MTNNKHISKTATRRLIDQRYMAARDEWLVLEAQQGSQAAFGYLYKRHNIPLRGFVLGLTQNAALADDITQQIWLDIAQSMARLRDPAAFRPWLFRRARWRVLDALKRGARDTPLENADDIAVSDRMQDATADQITRLLGNLPPREREVIILFYLSDMTLAEISEVTNTGLNTIKTHLKRGRDRLKKLTQAQNTDLTSAEDAHA